MEELTGRGSVVQRVERLATLRVKAELLRQEFQALSCLNYSSWREQTAALHAVTKELQAITREAQRLITYSSVSIDGR